MDEIAQAKSTLRKKILAEIRQSGPQRPEWDQAFIARLTEVTRALDWSSVLAFAPLASEPGIDPLIESWIHAGRTVLLPRVGPDPGVMEPVALDRPLGALNHDSLGVRTPEGPVWEGNHIDLILVPGCGFDEQLHRMGRGGGYYDRFLADRSHGLAVGIGYECQVAPSIPTGPHDRGVDALVTERRVLGSIAPGNRP